MTRMIDTRYPVERAKSDLDGILGHVIPVLDHGFIRVIDYMGNDESIVQMARVSYGTGTKTVSGDTDLIDYLMRKAHTSPFEGCEIKLHVKLPVFVARQWIRHRTANVNEYSARYSILDNEFYVPDQSVMMKQSTTNKQGREEVIDPDLAEEIRVMLIRENAMAYSNYRDISNEKGEYRLTRELARINLPVSIYTQWYWKTDLHNLFHFLRLRADAHAQYEIRAYAEAIKDICRVWVPAAAAAAEEHIYGAVKFSKTEMEAIRKMIGNCDDSEFLNALPEGFRQSRINEFIKKVVK